MTVHQRTPVSRADPSRPAVIGPDAVLDAAAKLLVYDSGASLGEVATAAGIGRTTLHKQYPTRQELLLAIGRRALDASEAAIAVAAAADDPLGRLVEDLLPFGAYQTVLGQHYEVFQDEGIRHRAERVHAPLAALVGASVPVRAGVPDWWLVRALHAILFTAWDLVQMGWLAPRDAGGLVRSTFLHGIAA